MDIDQLYDHITKHMSPENALKLLLTSSLRSYKKLKFDKHEEVHPVQIIGLAAMDMEWQIAIESDKENVEGITVGTKEYMKRMFK